MKRIITLITFILAATIAAQAGKIITDSIHSEILKADVSYNVYVPNSFEADPGRHYPAVYLLHGLTDDYTAWRDKGNMQIVTDELIYSGEAAEMIIVMPNAGGPNVHEVQNGYFNVEGWSYEDFFFREFIPAVEAKYRAGGSKGQRAVMGLSMGGGGSTVYCQRHPDMFSSCYAMSAWLDNKNDEVEGEAPRHDKLSLVCNSVRDHSALDFVDNADEATIAQLGTLKWFFDCGDEDFLLDLSFSLHQKMRARGINSELRVRNGTHNWEYWHLALRMALPFASRNFSK